MQNLETYKLIDRICKPITKNLPIQIVSYARFYPNATRLCLSTSPNFSNHFVETKDYFRSLPNPTMVSGLNSMVRIADVNALIVTTDSKLKGFYENMMSDGIGIFRVQPPYSILVSKPGYFEEFSFFPSVDDKGAYETLIANHDVLRHFMFYFLEQAHELIRQTVPLNFQNNEHLKVNTETANGLCLQAMQTKKYFLDTDTNLYLTKREAHCAHLITKNLNSREIAEAMNISNRTVEEYIDKIKLKSQITNKNKLQSYLCQTGFDHLLEFN
jgi:DNA-binding CsgD family transcriptional regulator